MTAAAPLIWAAVDFAVTGDPLFSLHYTSSSAEDLGRQRTLGEIPSALPEFFSSLVKLPVLLAALLGIGVSLWAAPRRAVMPLVLLLSGIGTFVLIGVAGLSVIERYLIVAALALLVFAAVGVGGFTMLRPGRLRTGWMVTSIVLVLAGVIFTATRVDLTKLTNELKFRGDAHASLVSVLHKPAVDARAALRAADRAEPQARARRALDPRPAARPRARARRPGGPAPAPRRRAVRHEPLRRSSATPSPTPSTRPPSRSRRTAGGGSRRATTSPPMPAAERRWLFPAGVAALVLGALGLRLWGFRHGLPFVYNADENAHFVAGAIGMFGHTYNPNYFINPPGYTYLLHAAFALGFGGRDGVSASYAADPSNVFALARALSGVLGAAAVGLLAWAGARLFDRRIGFVAAAVLAVAFLPVHYAHLALNDVPTLAPLCLALAGVGGVFARGRLLDYALAGVGLGFACATKYTGGIVLLPLLAAALVGRDQAVGAATRRARARRACWRSRRS